MQSDQASHTLVRGLDKRASCRKLEETKGWDRLGKTSLHQRQLTQSFPPPGISAKKPLRPCVGNVLLKKNNVSIVLRIPSMAF